MKILLPLLCALSLALTSCGDTTDQPADVYTISLLPDSASLLTGDTLILEPSITGGHQKEIEWSILPNEGSISADVYYTPVSTGQDTMEVMIIGRLRVDNSIRDTSVITLINRKAPPAIRDTNICFQRQVLPVLNQGCGLDGCHGPRSAALGLNVTDHQSLMKRITPYDADNSKIYRSIAHGSESFRMPPPGRLGLTRENIKTIKQWIQQGAKNTPCTEEPNLDTILVSYSRTIRPLMSNYCVGCHQPGRTNGKVDLSSYETVRAQALSPAFMQSICQTGSSTAMPPTIGKMSPMRIYQIEKWIREGMKK